MTTILYTQGETPIEKDKIIVNGILYPFESSNKDLWDNQTLLLEKRAMPQVDLKIKKDKNLSSNLMCCHKDGNGIYFQGLYKTTVKSGSRNYYMFYADTENIDIAIYEFKKQSDDILNYRWDDLDLIWIEKRFKKKDNGLFHHIKKRTGIVCLLIIAFIVSVVSFILKTLKSI